MGGGEGEVEGGGEGEVEGGGEGEGEGGDSMTSGGGGDGGTVLPAHTQLGPSTPAYHAKSVNVMSELGSYDGHLPQFDAATAKRADDDQYTVGTGL